MNENEKELKAKELDEQATELLKRKVKAMIVEKGYTMEKLANDLNEKYFTKESKANLSNKLKRGSLRYIDMQRIDDVVHPLRAESVCLFLDKRCKLALDLEFYVTAHA